MLVNGEEFVIYEFDTSLSIRNRIAARYKTIPKYLYPLPDDFYEGQDLEITDYLTVIKRATNLQTLMNTVPKEMNLDPIEDILPLYVVYNSALLRLPPAFQKAQLDVIQQQITDVYPRRRISADSIWNKRTEIKNSLEKQIKANLDEVESTLETFETFNRIEVGVSSSELLVEKIVYNVVLDMEDITLIELFNHLLLNDQVPFASFHSYYKIISGFIPSPDWGISFEEGIILKLKNKEKNEFTDIIFTIGEETKPEFTIEYELAAKQKQTPENIIETLVNLFQDDLANSSVDKMEETKVNGAFILPNQTLNTYVFADLIMNNPLFSSLMYTDESKKISRDRTSFFVHFESKTIGKLLLTLTPKVMEKTDAPFLRELGYTEITEGEPYVRVRVLRAKNLEVINQFQKFFSKLMVIYNQELPNIVRIYDEFIPSFGKKVREIPKVKKRVAKKAKLKNIAPDIFLPQYSRKCLQPPEVIDDDEVEEVEREGYKVMKFPRNPVESKQRNYVCREYEKYKYPGLRKNPLANADKFPYVPCCYIKDQSQILGSKYRHYFFGEPLKSKVSVQQELILTNKILKHNVFGKLPDILNKYFEQIDPDPEYQFLRKGNYRNPNSFLNCVLEGLHKQTGILKFNTKEARETELRKIRTSLSRYASTCKQEMYDSTIMEIQEEIEDTNVYLDPKKYIHLLETQYQCNIFLFTNDQMILPHHIQSYYKTKTRDVSLFIFEHMGAESDYAQYPQCELILRWKLNTARDHVYSFPYSSPITKKVQNTFDLLRESYALNRPLTALPYKIPATIQLIGQEFDPYGKSRVLHLNFMGESASLLTDPLQPLNLPEKTGPVQHVSKEVAVELAAALGLLVLSQTLDRNQFILQLNCKFNYTYVYIPIKPGQEELPGVPISDTLLKYFEDTGSNLNHYNQNKKYARYLSEYIYWLFSRFVQTQPGVEIDTDDFLIQFIKKKIKVDPEFKYNSNLVTKKFSTTSGFMKDQLLMLPNTETLKRLMYMLKLKLNNNKEQILNYYQLKKIPNFFLDLTDFHKYPFQVIIKGENSFQQLLKQKREYQLYHQINPEENATFFFKNPLINSTIYLAQNTSLLANAMDIGKVWAEEGYNHGNHQEIEEEADLEFIFYNYKNMNDIKPYLVSGEINPYNIRIAGYKKENKPQFTSLLSL